MHSHARGIPWTHIASMVSHTRSADAIRNRMARLMQDDGGITPRVATDKSTQSSHRVPRSSWTYQEDIALLHLVAMRGPKWQEFSDEFFSQRNAHAIRNRYSRVITQARMRGDASEVLFLLVAEL